MLTYRKKMYDLIDINEMAYAVYNATINPKQRKDVEQTYGKGLQQCWNQLNELCIELKKYYKVQKSNRKEILTTLEKFYGYELPMSLDFLDFTEADLMQEDEPPTSGPATQSCDTPSNETTTYDLDWLTSVCDDYLTANPYQRDIFTAPALADTVIMLLEAGGIDQNQEDLLNLLGEPGIEFVFEILQHRDALLDTGATQTVKEILKEEEPELSQRPIDDLGLDDTYLKQLKQQGLRLPNEPQGWKNQYKGYMSGIKLDHSITTDERISGKKKYYSGYEELLVEPQRKQATQNIPLISTSVLEEWGQMVFQGISTFNRLQSWVFDCAYNTDSNMLVCAPTGAGKTNVALLTILHEIKKNMEAQGMLKREELKIIYVAPMKALAQEVVGKFTHHLQCLGLIVRELTGDMQLTRQEIQETQVIVTTPEKWDVISRKAGDNLLVQKVKLLILDEVHLLASDRGNVVESITARTLRQIESTQSPIRLVGLSATLPNYMDVAEFLHVNMEPGKGLFYCDDSFRPVPLTQRFLGVTIQDKAKALEKIYELAYLRCVEELKMQKQAMVFVHSRKDTSVTAERLIEYATQYHTLELFGSPVNHPKYDYYKGRVQRSHNNLLQKLFQNCLGIHHAGMRRADRTLVEEMFADGIIKVLCCTATLAWGVNLPAHGVIIKGTQLYDTARGGWVDIDILDVIQIFGRAGRPQFDSTGEGCIIGMHDSIDNFARLMVMKTPIESTFMKNLCDHMNAEIIAGTVTNIREAIIWMQYTYMYIRMRKNPLVYGITNEERMRDPSLFSKCEQLVYETAEKLENAHMIRFDMETGNLFPTELGRIASYFYIAYTTVEIINEELFDNSNLYTILKIIAKSQEFASIKVRDEEIAELLDMKSKCCIVGKGDKLDDENTKTMILLQSYIKQYAPNEATLFSDFNFISQNAGRITRALFEICIQRGWAQPAFLVLNLCKSFEKRIWFVEHPLLQVPIHRDLLARIVKQELSLDDLREMDNDEICAYVDQRNIGGTVHKHVRMIPYYQVEAMLQPVTSTIIRVSVSIQCDYDWTLRVHGPSDSLWVWIENSDSHVILYSEQLQIPYKKRFEEQKLEFAIPVFPPFPEFYTLRVSSDHWIGADVLVYLPLRGLRMPHDAKQQTPLLDLDPLPVTALKNRGFQSFYRFSHFNAVQTQVFFKTYHTDDNILLCAPTGSGKTVVAELAVMRLLTAHKGEKAVYIGPLKSLVREKLLEWKDKFENRLHHRVIELTGDSAPELGQVQRADIIVTTPEKWDGVSRQWEQREYVQKVGVIIIDEIHLLGADRGPIIEVLISRLRFIAQKQNRHIRVIGLSTALANASDLGDWLGIKGVGLYNFSHSVRPVQLQVHISGYPGPHYCPRMATMNKPAYTAIRQYSPHKPVLVFVSSRRQTRLTAFGLINYAAFDNPFQWLHMSSEEMKAIIESIKDENLRETLPFGVGIHHAGLCAKDRMIVERLFSQEKIQILCTTSTLAWGVNLPAYLVIVKGTEFYDGKTCRWVDYPITDVLQMMGRAGRPQFDTEGVACVMVHDIKKNYYKKFLYEPFPVESSLHKNLHDHINAEIAAGNLKNIQDILDYISWTFFYRRLMNNPSYYGLYSDKLEDFQQYLLTLIYNVLSDLEQSKCIQLKEDRLVKPLRLGEIASFYYIQHTTVRLYAESLRSVETVPELLDLISKASEYDPEPVRHNEGELIEEFSKLMYWQLDRNQIETYEDPHLKVYLLLQGFMLRLPLPITDFINDQNSVLDNSIRLINALADIAGFYNLSSQLLLIIQTMPYLIQAVMPHDSQLYQLEGTDAGIIRRLNTEGIHTLMDLRKLPEPERKAVFEKCRIERRACEKVNVGIWNDYVDSASLRQPA